MPKSASTVAPSRPQPLFGEKDAPTLDGVDCDAMPLPEDLEPHGEGQRSLVADVSKAKGWSLRANALWQANQWNLYSDRHQVRSGAPLKF